jgi:acyl-CoA reductase-like NAD-dependent aldehyde dehydrogenase
MDIINPATGERIASLDSDQQQSLDTKLAILQAGQKKWMQVPLQERITILERYATLLESNLETLAQTLTAEVGKPLQQARNEINGSRTRIAWLTANAMRYLSPETMYADDNLEETIHYEPLGVVCNISAWNYPFLVGTNVFVPALLAGNSVCYKPSEYATLTGLHIERLLKEAGIPDDAFQMAIGGSPVGEMLLNMPFDGYYFTGSYKTGKYIYEKAAAKMVPCQCELGGKDPLYVTDEVLDIKAVAAGTADGAFYNNGQSCCAVERIYVHENVYDAYVKAFVEEVNSWQIGDPMQDGIYIGPLSRQSHIQFLTNQVEDALNKGAQLLCGGYAPASKGFYFTPTVFAGVTHEMDLMREETFGPLIGIMKVKDDEEAIRMMNDTVYGLTASVYSTNRERAAAILEKMDTGTAYWNCCDRVTPTLPWSGRNQSGFGSTLGHAGIRAFTQPKAYHLRK